MPYLEIYRLTFISIYSVQMHTQTHYLSHTFSAFPHMDQKIYPRFPPKKRWYFKESIILTVTRYSHFQKIKKKNAFKFVEQNEVILVILLLKYTIFKIPNSFLFLGNLKCDNYQQWICAKIMIVKTGKCRIN